MSPACTTRRVEVICLRGKPCCHCPLRLGKRERDLPTCSNIKAAGPLSRAAAKHTTVAKRKCTTGVMGDGSDLGVSGGTGTVGRGPWEDYGPACSGADDAVASCRLPFWR